MSIEIGNRLRQARESQGFSLETLEAQTRIPKQYLLALEQGKFELLPSPIYVRSYLRAYANAVGENPQYLLKHYRPSAVRQDDDHSYTKTERMTRTDYNPYPDEQPADFSSTQRNIHIGRAPYQPESSMGYEPPRQESYGESRRPYPQHTQDAPYRQEDLRQTMRGERLRRSVDSNTRTDLSYPQETAPSVYGSTAVSRRTQMPVDMPTAREMGMETRRMERREIAYPPSLPSRRTGSMAPPPRRLEPVIEVEEVNNESSGFGKLYTWLLVIGAFALAAAVAGFIYLKFTIAEGKPINTNPVVTKPIPPQPSRPLFSLISSDPNGVDEYEIANVDQLQLDIQGLKGTSRFDINTQEVGPPMISKTIHAGSSNSNYQQSFPSDIWITLYNPTQVSVYVNGFNIGTNTYTTGKKIKIDFSHK